MKQALALLVVCTGLLAASPAFADRVVLVSGGSVKGTIVKETRRLVKIRKKSGMLITIKRDEIDRIEKTDWKKVLAEREKGLTRSDYDKRVELAIWCTDHALDKDAKRLCEWVIQQKPSHEGARRFLGYRLVKGEWLRGTKLKKALGYVFYKGKWVTPETMAEREAAIAAKKRRALAPKPRPVVRKGVPGVKVEARPVLPEDEESLLRAVRGSGPEARREEAARALASKGGQAKTALRITLNEALTKAKKKLIKHFESGKGKIRSKLARRIVPLRKKAYAIIFDKGIYPDANHGASGQPTVDKAVNKLVRAYDDPLRELADESDVKDLMGEVKRLAGWASRYGGAAVDAGGLERELAAEVAKSVDMRRFPVDATDAKLLRASQGVMVYNAKKKTHATAPEKECMRVTNEYRMLFGLRALKLHNPLVRAARGHSSDMERLRFFDHTSRVPGKRSPADRCKAEGASYAGENIAMGMNTGRGAFNAWYTSSGHHRNILTKSHKSIGVGQKGKYWTQNFGYDSPK
jgi:uncharacterized protein YkwD